MSAVAKIGKRGTVVLPSRLRARFGFHEGDLIIAEDHGDGILIRPAIALPLELYTNERKAEFLLSNAVSEQDYQEARKAVKEMGLDPDKITHYKKK
jgi:AbrB family looped-hinge helix DNA binding protein